MTTQGLGRSAADLDPADDGALGVLFERSPAVPAHTAPAAEISFLLGLVAVLAVPFSLTYGLSVVLAGLCVVTSVVGLAQASRTGVAGGVLAAAGLVLSLATLAVVGLRYTGVGTTFGDPLLPQLGDALRALNDLVPRP